MVRDVTNEGTLQKKRVYDNRVAQPHNYTATYNYVSAQLFYGPMPPSMYNIITGTEGRITNDKFHLRVFPNPSHSKANVEFTLSRSSNINLKLYNSMGVDVGILFEGTVQAGKHNFPINIENYPEGTYMVRLQEGGNSSSQRIMVKK